MASKKQLKPAKDEAADRKKKEFHAKLACRASVNGAAVATEYAGMFGEQDISALIDELSTRTKALKEGDMAGVEAMLYSQAHALQSIFVNLSRRAIKQEYLKQFGTYLGLALKAQAQCRVTLETLAEVKYPKAPTFVRQQNVAYQQQVNNGGVESNATNTRTHAREKSANQSNELLEASHGERLVSGEAGTAGSTNPELATVETLHRPQNKRGQSS
jgi:hypothetical protein